MKTVTKYVSDDGTEFLKESDCERHEKISSEISAVAARLPKIDHLGSAFSNGSGFIQHDQTLFLSVRREILNIAHNLFNHRWTEAALLSSDNDMHSYSGNISYLIANSALPALKEVWYRLSCTDESFREWGQPFFASRPQSAKQVQLNS